ncbi:protein MAINTENANCE OF MERISTEMS-like [Nicotiana sylvestris]|uniref:protein MAINTENANCE OF MERISTEMS-like n=1 Tax=Nicotiana sylvestris TaxID=4096 RepID=UPI00388C7D25
MENIFQESIFNGKCLASYQIHLWNVLKIVDHVENLSLWEVSNVVLVDRLQGIGFENLAKIFNLRPSRHEHLTKLISALVHFYDADKRCFLFNGLDFFFGLEDILKISGLPIDGKSVIGQDGKDEKFDEKYLGVTKEYLGVTNGKGIDLKTGGICLRSLGRKYGNSDCLNSQYIRVYVLYIIVSVIAPRTKFAVPGYFLALLDDVDKIEDYAWGAAMLAYLHKGLESAKK